MKKCKSFDKIIVILFFKKKQDLEGNRTVGVLTKLDLMVYLVNFIAFFFF